MKIPFPRTTRWMTDDRGVMSWPVLALLGMTTLGWALWFFAGRVRVYAVSQQARTEVDRMAHVVQSPVEGVVQENYLTLGRRVEPGDVLLVVDSVRERLQVAQEKARRRGQQRAREVLEKELSAEAEALHAQAQTVGVATQVAQARGTIARTLQEHASAEDRVVQELRTNALATGLEALKSASEARRQQAEAVAARLEASRIASSGQTELKDRAVRVVRLEHEVATLQSEIELTDATLARLEYEIERRTVRAALAGVVADVSPALEGGTLSTGQKVAVVVPPGMSRVIARFAPSEAVGRLREGQLASVRLDAFPWTEYGVMKAQVAQVAREPQDGLIRTELEVMSSNPLIPLSHGMTGSVEIELEELPPYRLLLRAAGQVLGAPPAPATAEPAPSSARLP